jgi:hypothetical protein
MFEFLRRSKVAIFEMPDIGDRWMREVVRHDGRDVDLAVRELPPGSTVREAGRFVALIQPEPSISPNTYRAWTDALQRALEAEGKGVLVVVQADTSQITWYAYASKRETLDEIVYAQRATHPMRWGIQPDADWAEYEFARKLVRG